MGQLAKEFCLAPDDSARVNYTLGNPNAMERRSPAPSSSLPRLPSLPGYQCVRTLSPDRSSFLAIAESGGRQVVIKRLDPACLSGDGSLHPDVRQRLNRIRELAVPGVANLISVERCEDGYDDHAAASSAACYLVWEWRSGQTLAEWFSCAGEPSQRLIVARELVLLVESLHAAGLVHGSLHLRNVIRDPRGGKLWLTHLSPLLVSDVEPDVEATAQIARALIGSDALPNRSASSSLRNIRLSLGGLIESPGQVSASRPAAQDSETLARRWTLIAAIAVAALGGALSLAIWTWISAK